MRVLYFMNHVGKGGAALALYDLIVELKHLHPNNEYVVFTSKKSELNKMFDEIGVENYSVLYFSFLYSQKKCLVLRRIILSVLRKMTRLYSINRIINKIDISKIDIIHTNLDRIDIGAYLSKKYSIPHVWHFREHLDSDFPIFSNYRNYVSHINRFDSHLIFISDSVSKAWINRGVISNKSHLIYDGINYSKLNSRNINNDKILFLFLGGYSQQKGQEFFIKALSELPNSYLDQIHIDFYGNGNTDYISYLNEILISKGLCDVCTLNDYDKSIYDKISLYDIGVNCSNSEGFGRVTVEYMFSGLCPLVSNSGANPELVINNESGLHYINGNQQSLINTIIWICNNRKKIEMFKNEAIKRAKRCFSIRDHAEKVYDLYLSLLNRSDV